MLRLGRGKRGRFDGNTIMKFIQMSNTEREMGNSIGRDGETVGGDVEK